MRWEKGGDGRFRLVAGDPTPEEAEAGALRIREIIETRQPPAADIWKPESTVLATGAEIGSRRVFKEELKKRGLVEISGSEVNTVKKSRPTAREIAVKAVEEAKAFLKETGQYVEPGTPTTARTKERIAAGQPILDRMPLPPKESPLYAELPSTEDVSESRVDTSARSGVPWGYVGDKEDFRKMGIQAAFSRASKQEEVRPI